MSNYLEPELYSSASLDEILNPDNTRLKRSLFGSNLSFKALFGLKTHNVVISEPGYGKSRLLKEIVLNAQDYNKEAIYIDMKSVKERNIESFITSGVDKFDTVNTKDKQDLISGKSNFKTGKFQLNDHKDIIVCLDALDEVHAEVMSSCIENFVSFFKSYNQTTIILSCRRYYLEDNYDDFSDKNLRFIEIDKFQIPKVRKYLLNDKISKQTVDKIIESFHQYETASLICVPRYLEIFADLINNNQINIEKMGAVKRTELFEKFIYKDLDVEDKVKRSKKKEITKRVLEKLALVMEINMCNEISKDDLMTFFDDINSGLVTNFLQQIKLEYFYERSLLKDNNRNLEFQNSEFQEYLAAKEISRLGNIGQTIFDFTFSNDLKEIHPSWFNTLNYLIELHPELFSQIFEYIERNGSLLEIDKFHRFLTKICADDLKANDKALIFQTIFEYYERENVYIYNDIAQALANYFSEEHEIYLKKAFDARRSSGEVLKIKRINSCRIIKYLLKKNKLHVIDWRKKLLELTKTNDPQLVSSAIITLAEFNDIRLIQRIENSIHASIKNDDRIENAILNACITINPNHDYTLEKIVSGIKSREHNVIYTLSSITESAALEKLLDYFLIDDLFLRSILEEATFFQESYDLLFENIDNAWNENFLKKLKELIYRIYLQLRPWNHKQSGFTKNILSLLANYAPNFTFELIESIKKSENLKFMHPDIQFAFSILLNGKQLEQVINDLKEITGDNSAVTNIIIDIKNSDRIDAGLIYDQSKKYLQNDIEVAEKINRDRQNKKKQENKKLYRNFKFMLEPEKEKYMQNVFNYYLENEKELNQLISGDEKNRLVYLVKLIFEKLNPAKQKVVILKVEKTSTSYKIHEWMPIFGECIKIAAHLKISVNNYRKKIMSYIPFSYPEELSAIFDLIENPEPNEIKTLINIYKEPRKDDLHKFRPMAFVDACSKYNIRESIPILQMFVENDALDFFVREAALKTLARIEPNDTYFREVFSKYHNSTNETEEILRDLSNSFLIIYNQDDDAIDWKFKELEERAFPYLQPEGVHIRSGEKDELRNKNFARPLMDLSNPNIIDKYNELLDKSFDIYNKGENYHEYAFYLWDIIIKFFENLKEHNNYSYISNLEKEVVENHNSKQGVNWFKEKLKKLKLVYMLELGKPASISECIQKYNQIKQKTYKKISYPEQLLQMVLDIVDTDIERWVHSEGAYQFINYLQMRDKEKKQQEDLIQKTLKTQLEVAFLRRGLRPNETNIRREEHLLDNKRTDFLISYGFVQPIMIEIKLLDNNEITNEKERTKYKQKFIQYIEGTKSKYGIYLIFRTKNEREPNLDDRIREHNELYKDCPNVTIKGFDCLKNIEQEGSTVES